jgi:hypothetical protein
MLIFTAIGILISIIIFLNYSLGFTLVIALRILVPGTVVRFFLGPLDISLNTFLSIMLFVALVLKKQYKGDTMPAKLIHYILIFCISLFVFIPFAPVIPFMFQIKMVLQFIVVDLSIGLFAWYAIRNLQQVKCFCIIIFVSTFIGCVYGIFTYVIGENPYIILVNLMYDGFDFLSDFYDEGRGLLTSRISGTQDHPLTWGQMLGVILSFFFLMQHGDKKNVSQPIIRNKGLSVLFFIGIVLILINIFLTGSRSALFVVFVCLGFVFLSFSLRKKIKYIVIGGVCIFFTIIIISAYSSSSKIDALIAYVSFWDEKKAENAEIGGSSVFMRTEQLNSTFEILEGGYQLFGLGYGTAYLASPSVQRNQDAPINELTRIQKINDLLGFESVLFRKLVEQGCVGLFFFLYFYFKVYWFIRKKQIQQEKRKVFIVDAFFLSYLGTIIITGIQGTFYLFFLLSVLYLKYLHLTIIPESKILNTKKRNCLV